MQPYYFFSVADFFVCFDITMKNIMAVFFLQMDHWANNPAGKSLYTVHTYQSLQPETTSVKSYSTMHNLQEL